MNKLQLGKARVKSISRITSREFTTFIADPDAWGQKFQTEWDIFNASEAFITEFEDKTTHASPKIKNNASCAELSLESARRLPVQQSQGSCSQLLRKTSPFIRAVMKQVRRIDGFWRGKSPNYPYTFKKCELIQKESTRKNAVRMSINVSNKTISKVPNPDVVAERAAKL